MVSIPTPSRKFSPNQVERYDLHSQLIDRACKIALEEKIVTQELLDKFIGGATAGQDNLLYYAKQFGSAKPDEKNQWFEKMTGAAKFSPEEQGKLVNLLDVLVPVINAANSVRESEQPNANPGQIFRNYLIAGLTVDKEGKNAFGMEPDKWLDALGESKANFIMSWINTVHPTNFYTEFGRSYEEGLLNAVRNAKYAGKDEVLDPTINARLGKAANEPADSSGVLNMDALDRAFSKAVRDACGGMNEKPPKTLTFLKKVTVGEENETDKRVIAKQRIAIDKTFGMWNEILSDKKVATAVRNLVIATGNDSLPKKVRALLLNQEEKDKAFEQRTWVGSDADGRSEATDTAFFQKYMDEDLREKSTDKYTGPILDLRDNAEVRKRLVGGLISKKYNSDPDFRAICNEFCADTANHPLGEHWKNSKGSVFQWLSEKNQTKFIEYLVEKRVDLFDRRAMESETLGFNEQYYKVFQALIKKYDLNKHTSFAGLTADQNRELLDKLDLVKGEIVFGSNGRSSTGGYKINRVLETPDEKAPKEIRDIIGFHYSHSNNEFAGKKLTVSDLLNEFTKNANFDTKKPEAPGNEPLRLINKDESLACMSYLRRLFVVNKCVDEQKGKAVIVDREQAANFENASDFFTQLYLHQQTGLVKIENGVVSEKPKIGIQPLFETTPEIKRAGEIVGEILQSRLGVSYYKQRGKAEFMVGYSDGAKSGGNFASHYWIRKCEKDIIAQFDKLKTAGVLPPEFEVRFMRGPGRGENRGGVRRYDRQYVLHHDVANKSAVNDQTIQSDLNIRMEIDPEFAERTAAEMTVSGLAGAVEARREKDDLEKRRIESFEKACEFIAAHSENAFKTGVFDKTDEFSAYLAAVVKNPDASSRASKRAGTDQKGIGPERAVPVESAALVTKFPMHDYGLQQALDMYIKKGPPVLDKKGKPVSGQKALNIMAQDFAFFREEMKLATLRQQNFDPYIAEIWSKRAEAVAEKTAADAEPNDHKRPHAKSVAVEKQTAFFEDIKESITGLGDKCYSILMGRPSKAFKREDYSGEPFMGALASAVQALITANPDLSIENKKKAYLPLYAPGSEQPAGPMRTEIPGLANPREVVQSLAV